MFLNRLVCLVAGHKRSARKARFDGSTFVSKCRVCGRPMRKGDDGMWETC